MSSSTLSPPTAGANTTRALEIRSAPNLRARLSNSSTLTWNTMRLLCFAVLILVVVIPVAWLAVYSCTDGRTGGFTLANYAKVFTDSLYYVPFLRALRLGATVSVLCVVIGTSMAYLVARTDMPGRTALRYVVYLSFIVPSLLAGVAWVILASPNAGLLNKFLDSTLGIKPLNVFSITAMSLVMALALYPLTFIFVLNSLDMQSGDIDEAGAILGASAPRRALTISLPLVLPAILNAALLAFLQAISLYAIPALLAIPAGEQVLTTQLYQLFGFPRQPELAAAYTVPLILLAVVVLTIRRKLLGRRGYATVGGRATRTVPVKLRAWRWPATVYCWFIVTVAVALPGLTLLYISVIPQWANGGTNFTLAHYRWVFENAKTPVWNTIQFSLAAAVACVILGFFVSYLAERRQGRFDKLLEFLTTTPIVLPGMIIAIGMFAAFSRPPLLLYGTGLLLVVVFLGRFMPTALQNIQPAIRSIHPDLENASRSLGAGIYRTIAKVTVPLSSSVLISAWIFTFVLSTHEVSAAILLVSLDTDVMATQVMNLYEQAKYEQIAALGIVLVAITMVAVIIGTTFGGRRVLNRGKEF